MRGDLKNFDKLAERNVLLDGDDVGARHHDSFDSGFPEPEDVLEHCGFFGGKVGLRLFRSQDELKVRARRSRPPTEQHALEAREPAFTVFAVRRHHDPKCVTLGRFGAWSRVSHLWSSVFLGLQIAIAILRAPSGTRSTSGTSVCGRLGVLEPSRGP
jgi:hypothetical protein